MDVEHDGAVDAGDIGLDRGEDVVEQIVVVNLRVEALRRVAARRRGDHANAVVGVDGRLPLGEDDEGAARLVEARVHARRGLPAAGQRQPDVRLVTHPVGLQRPKHRVAYIV